MSRPCVVSPASPEPQPMRDSRERLRTGFIKGALTLPFLYPPPPKNLRGEENIYTHPGKALFQRLSFPSADPNANSVPQQQQIHSLRTGADTRSHMQRPGKQNISLWGSQMLPKWLNRVERRMLIAHSMLLVSTLHQNRSPLESTHCVSAYVPRKTFTNLTPNFVLTVQWEGGNRAACNCMETGSRVFDT